MCLTNELVAIAVHVMVTRHHSLACADINSSVVGMQVGRFNTARVVIEYQNVLAPSSVTSGTHDFVAKAGHRYIWTRSTEQDTDTSLSRKLQKTELPPPRSNRMNTKGVMRIPPDQPPSNHPSLTPTPAQCHTEAWVCSQVGLPTIEAPTEETQVHSESRDTSSRPISRPNSKPISKPIRKEPPVPSEEALKQVPRAFLAFDSDGL